METSLNFIIFMVTNLLIILAWFCFCVGAFNTIPTARHLCVTVFCGAVVAFACALAVSP